MYDNLPGFVDGRLVGERTSDSFGRGRLVVLVHVAWLNLLEMLLMLVR